MVAHAGLTYANAADAAARRTLIGAEDAAYTLRATISADFTTSSATFVDVTGLTVTIPAGQTWVQSIIDGAYQSTNAATGSRGEFDPNRITNAQQFRAPHLHGNSY